MVEVDLDRIILGKKIEKMCDLLDEKYPDLTEENTIIKQGFSSLMYRSMGVGFLFGCLLSTLITTIILIMML